MKTPFTAEVNATEIRMFSGLYFVLGNCSVS